MLLRYYFFKVLLVLVVFKVIKINEFYGGVNIMNLIFMWKLILFCFIFWVLNLILDSCFSYEEELVERKRIYY